jgi:hypothetical protein
MIMPSVRKAYVPPLTNDDFLAFAPNEIATISGKPFEMTPREFSSGSVGYYTSGKVDLLVKGAVVKCQVSVNVTVIGSKPKENAA